MIPAETLFVFMLILMRVVGMFLYAPVFSHSSIPVLARVALAVGLSLIVYPFISFSPAYPEHIGELIFWMAKELLIGLFMGFAIRMLFFILDFASYVLTVEIGLMPSPEFDPSRANAFNPLGSIVYFLGIMLLLSGTEYDILRAFVMSYQVSPIGFTDINSYAVEHIIRATAGIFKTGIMIAAPVLAVNFLVNLVFAVLGKVVAKLNVFILSFPVRIITGTTVLAGSVTILAFYALSLAEQTPEEMLRYIIFRPVN